MAGAPVLVVLLALAPGADPERPGEVEAARGDAPRTDTPEWEAMRRRLAQDKVKVELLKKEEASILKGLEALDRALADKHKAEKRLVDEIRHLENNLATLDEKLAKAEAKLGEVRAAAGQRASAMHRLRRTRLTELFREVRSPIELRRLRERLRLVLAFDAGLVAKAREASESSRSIRDSMKEKKEALQKSRDALAKEVEEAAMLREERAALLEGIRHEKRASERLAGELVHAAKRLEKELGTIRGASPAPEAAPGGFDAQVGRLPWPVMGRVEVPFGKKVDPGSDMVMVQKGLDLRAPIAEPVRAVFGGTVVYADWFEGFGRMIILEHEGGFYSLYAHLESFEVAKGHQVAQHQVIGLVGDSGSTKGAYLYFELRKGRDAIDPMRWLVP